MTTESGVELVLAEQAYPAFGPERGSLWCDYGKLAADGIVSVTGSLVVTQPDPNERHVWVDLYFAEGSFDCRKYGLPYGDDLLEASIRAVLADTLSREDIGGVTYTEQGMQTHEYVSLEATGSIVDVISSLSAHDIVRINRGRSRIVSLANARGRWAVPDRPPRTGE